MEASTPLDLVKYYTYSPVERRDIAELQETAKKPLNDLTPFFTPPAPFSFVSVNCPRRLLGREFLDERTKRRFEGIIFNSLTNGLKRFTQVQNEGPLAKPPLDLDFTQGEDSQELQPSLSLCLPPPSHHTEHELETYFDDEFKTYYFVPIPFREVSSFVEKFQMEGGYLGQGCGRLTKLKNLTKEGCPEERCDIITLTKNPRQVEYEGKTGTSDSHFLGIINTLWNECSSPMLAKSVKKWQANQVKACAHIMEELPAKIEEWHYESFMIADESMLRTLGYTDEDTKKMHLLALFYKRVPMQP